MNSPSSRQGSASLPATLGRRTFRHPDRRRRRSPDHPARARRHAPSPRCGQDHSPARQGALQVVTSQPCLVCGRTPSEAHHVRFAQPRALGRKVSDEYTVLSAGSIAAICTATAMRPHGGPRSASTLCLTPQGLCLLSGSIDEGVDCLAADGPQPRFVVADEPPVE
jgi:hypothetical protein